MIAKQEQVRLLFPFVALLLTLSLTVSGCGSTPTLKPQPTFALEAHPGAEVQVGKSVAIVARVEPLEKLDLTWSVSGTAGGKLNTYTGEQVVYTAGKEGVDIVVAEGTTASGAPVKQTVTLTVVGEVVAEVPTLTATPVPPTDTPMPPTDTPVPPPGVTPTPTPLPSSTTVVNAIHVDQPPTIDGRLDLDEEIWSQAQPLIYAEHPPVNDSTTVVVRLLWDDKYLYAGFDVSDTQVESSSATPWDGDSVSVIIDNGGQIQVSGLGLLDYGRRSGSIERYLKGTTTFNNSSDQDEGYSIEMRIPWVRTPAAGSTIAADFLSIDHDYNPGGLFDDPDTVFSRISWDGDGSVDTAMKSILLGPTLTPLPAEALIITDPSKEAEVGPIITVRGEWVEVAERGDLHLEVLVRALVTNEPYWVQTRPDITNDGTWRSIQVRIGREGMDVGTHFDICAVATTLDLMLGEQLYELPEGPNFCVSVTRK